MIERKEPTFFEVQNSIVNNKNISDESVKKHFVGFMAVKWLSMNPMACYVANTISSTRGNKYIPKEAEYRFLKNSIKLPKTTYLKDNKSVKDYNHVLGALQIYYAVGRSTMKDYINILGGERILIVLNKLSMGNTSTTDAEIIKLRKAVALVKNDLLKIKGLK